MNSYRNPVSTNLIYQKPKCVATKPEMSGSRCSAPASAGQSSNSYDAWKRNIERNTKPNTSILKKQVTFKGSETPKNSTETVTKLTGTEARCNNEFVQTPLTNRGRQFEKIYMANIPHRSLDLSLIDVAKPIIKPQESDSSVEEPEEVVKQDKKVPTTYKEFLEWQKSRNNDRNSDINSVKKLVETEKIITDIFNYNSPKGISGNKTSRDSMNCNDKILPNHVVKKSLRSPIEIVEKVEAAPKEKYLPVPQCDIFSAGKDKTHDSLHDSFRGRLNEEQCFVNGPTNKPQVCSPPNNRMWNDRINNVLIQSNHANPLPNQHKARLPTNDFCDVPKRYDQTQPGRLSDSASQTSIVCCPTKNTDVVKTDEITVKDLLTIIQQQNEQLLLLQKQIANLLDRKEGPKQIEEPHQKSYTNQNKVLTNGEQGELFNSPGSTPRKGPLSKFSIDLMTSFEVSIRPPQNIFQRKQRDLNNEPKIQEIIEKETTDQECDRICRKELVDSSLRLEEPLNIRESTPSPEPSIKIDMKEFESSDDDNDEDMTSKIGATFYKEMMRQVNIIIQKAQKNTNNRDRTKPDQWGDETLNRTKDAIRHIKKIAKNFSTIDEGSASDDATECDKDTSDQINFAMKQLLMKYLPDEQLVRLTETQQKHLQMKNSQDKIIMTSRTPEFSFATVEFMKKYNLISTNGNVPQKHTKPQKPNLHAKALNSNMLKKLNGNNPKILDISVLKQQPKLL